MQPLGILKCLGKALLRSVGFFGDVLVSAAEQAWLEWYQNKSEQQRRVELQELVRMAQQDLHQHIEAVIRELADDRRAEIKKELFDYLNQVPQLLRHSLARPEDQSGQSVPPELPLRSSQDLICLLSSSGAKPMNDPSSSADVPAATITLTLMNGPNQGRQFTYTERTTCIIGRHNGCGIRFPNEEATRAIGRHHCFLDINPPDLFLRDLGSKTGTYVNDRLIGMRKKAMTAEEGRALSMKSHKLNDGDVIRLSKKGAAVFEVSIVVPTQCMDCGVVIPEEEKVKAKVELGVYRCASCWNRANTLDRPARACAQCGTDVSAEEGAERPGAFICRTCRNNPEQLLSRHQSQDRAKLQGLPTIQGYTVRKMLGKGGMGMVWLATHDRTQQEVAIKMMLPEVAASERAVTRALREMSHTGKLNHPHVVSLYDTGYADGAFFMVLEYCAGGSVDRLMLQRGGTLPIDEAVEIAMQALEGLHCAEQNKIVHRDLKPANVFLSGEGSARVAKVGDYGLAKAFDDAGLNSLTRAGEVAGTPFFMPRQQVINFKNAGYDVDVWAMAATLYNMLTGEVPREFKDHEEMWMTILENDVVPIRKRNPSIPVRLAEVVDLALREDPEIYFKNAIDFKKALEASL